MWNIVGQVVSIVVGVVGLASLIVTYLHNRDANDIDRFEAITSALDKRVDDLERELERIKQALVTEQGEHTQTRRTRDISLRYNRVLIAHHDRGGDEPWPEPPAELVDDL
jgi:hypothetical protein